jgi:hypothetical protein
MTNKKIVPGDLYSTNSYGEVVVLEYKDASNVLVRFDNGHEQWVQTGGLRRGLIRNQSVRRIIKSKSTESCQAGSQFKTNNSGVATVLEYRAADDVLVQFEDGSTKITTAASLKRGKVQNNNLPSVYGVGYMSDEFHSHDANRKIIPTYNLWFGMMTRAYNEKYHSEKPTYKEVIVCDEWLHYKNFKKWCEAQVGFGTKGFNLDKDILVKGNKVYGPEFCVFVPSEMNSQLTKANAAHGLYPIGVSWHSEHEKFMACFRANGKTKYLGYYTNPEDAFNAYKVAKEAYLKHIADKYKDVVDPRVVEALYAYKVEMTD